MRFWVGLRLAHARCLLLEAQDRLQTYGELSRHDVRQHPHELLTNPLCARPTPANGVQKPGLEPCAAVLQCEVSQCRLHGGALGSGALSGERKGAWKGGRYSRSITPAQRHQAWKDYWAAKRAQNTALADIPDISEELQTLWPQS
jgi:hypothetical protein